MSKIIPYKNAVLELAKGSKLVLGGGDVELGCDKLLGSKAETWIRLRENATWTNEGGCRISYGATVEVLSNGLLDSLFFTMNSGSVLIAADRIHLGCDVMIGRNVVIYDSDHHAIRNDQGEITNRDAPVFIGDHVWLATNVTVLKGTTIGAGSVVGANSVVRGCVPAYGAYQTPHASSVREQYGSWSREHP